MAKTGAPAERSPQDWVDEDLVDLSASFASLRGDELRRAASDALAGRHGGTAMNPDATRSNPLLRRRPQQSVPPQNNKKPARSVGAAILNTAHPAAAPPSKWAVGQPCAGPKAPSKAHAKGEDSKAAALARGAGRGWT
jgi:hypothetical protein